MFYNLKLKSAYAVEPCSCTSRPSVSSVLLTRSPIVSFMIVKMMNAMVPTKAMTDATPISCVTTE